MAPLQGNRSDGDILFITQDHSSIPFSRETGHQGLRSLEEVSNPSSLILHLYQILITEPLLSNFSTQPRHLSTRSGVLYYLSAAVPETWLVSTVYPATGPLKLFLRSSTNSVSTLLLECRSFSSSLHYCPGVRHKS